MITLKIWNLHNQPVKDRFFDAHRICCAPIFFFFLTVAPNYFFSPMQIRSEPFDLYHGLRGPMLYQSYAIRIMICTYNFTIRVDQIFQNSTPTEHQICIELEIQVEQLLLSIRPRIEVVCTYQI